MTFPDAIRRCLTLYATFGGRARRSEFWFFWLFNLLAHGVAGILDVAIFGIASPLNAIVSLLLLVPNLAVAVRRLHDGGRSGWWLLIVLVPLLGILVLLFWSVRRGEDGPNRFGADPRAIPQAGTARPWPVSR